MQTIVFSSAHLPPELTDLQRERRWCDAFCENFGAVEFGVSEAPFEARLDFVQIGDLGCAHMFGSINRTRHGLDRDCVSAHERFALVTNRSTMPACLTQAGVETVLPPSASVLLSHAIPGRLDHSADLSEWFLMEMPRRAILEAVPNAEDLLGVVLGPDCEAQRMLSAYSQLIVTENGFSDPLLRGHISKTLVDLVALALGSCVDYAAVARQGGLRAARLDAVLREIRNGHADPNFSAAMVARQLSLSERYVQDLLQGTGSGFSERVINLRLQTAKQLIDAPGGDHRKISDIAYTCGFNDLSYFHRCFRRRFGMTPAGARVH